MSMCDAKVYPPSLDGAIGISDDDVYGADKIVVDGRITSFAGSDTVLSGAKWLNFADKCGYIFPTTDTSNVGELKHAGQRAFLHTLNFGSHMVLIQPMEDMNILFSPVRMNQKLKHITKRVLQKFL